MGSCAVGLDIGGTFTDVVLLDRGEGGPSPIKQGEGGPSPSQQGGRLRLHKVPTTPADPAEGAMRGLSEVLAAHGASPADCETLVHGTTLVTNAVIERRGATTALLTTRGFRDVLEMGREQRYDIYDLFLRYPEPLVPRQRRLEVEGRLDRDGRVLEPLDEEGVLEAGRRLVAAGAEAVAICFVHSYRNPAHERRAAELLREAHPGLAVCASFEVVPEIREFERTATTTCNAYVRPLVDRYLANLRRQLAEGGFGGRLYLMQSSGGLMSPEAASTFPVRLLESGPAGGAMVAAFLGRQAGLEDCVAFDMGGTTAKMCVVTGGRPQLASEMEAARVHRFQRGSGIPLKVPVLDLMEIGAGGGSIAARSRLGLLQVGPQSAGADPGPAAYGRGGSSPTVTDACLCLGYLDPDYFLGGAMALDRDAAVRAVGGLGQSLGLDLLDAAWGIYQVVCERMAAAARVHVIEQGQDPRRFPLIAFGGAGPLHAVRVARALGSPEVLVPPVSGVASALGFLVAPAAFEFGRSRPAELAALDWGEVTGLFAELEAQGLETVAAAGVREPDVRLERSAEMRLTGQFHDIEVPVPGGTLDEGSGSALTEAFETEYRRRYHAVLAGYAPLVLNWRLRAVGPEPRITVPYGAALLDGASGPERPAQAGRRAYFPEAGGLVETPVLDRYALVPGERREGPLIVEERESTTIVGPGDAVSVDVAGNLRVAVCR